MTPADLTELLAARLRELWGGPVEVTGLRLLPGGASRETWSADAHLAGGDAHLAGGDAHLAGGPVRPLIVRRDSEARPDPGRMAVEAAAFAAAQAAGVPEPVLYDHGEVALGAPYLIMERLAGETIGRRLLRDSAYAGVRPRLAYALGAILARIHRIDPAAIPGLPRVDALPELAGWYRDLGEPRPAVELGLRWLASSKPLVSGDAVVHGDFRIGNLLIDGAGVRGVLDWELVHRGDPFADLGWLCTKAWRYGSVRPVGGMGSRAELLAGYAAGGGTPPDMDTLRWWEVYGTVRWTLLCRRQAERHLSGAEPSVELAVLGRKVCENEHDILLALGLAEPCVVADPLDGAASLPVPLPHDRPVAAGLLIAVEGFLAEVVRDGDPRRGFHARVAANALRIARREALLGAGHARAHAARLAGLGCADDAELCAAIRDGTLDHRREDVTAAVRDAVRDKLLVANPAHLAIPG